MIPTHERLVHVKHVSQPHEGAVEVTYEEVRTKHTWRQPFSVSNGGAPKLGTDVYIQIAEDGQVIGPWRPLR